MQNKTVSASEIAVEIFVAFLLQSECDDRPPDET